MTSSKQSSQLAARFPGKFRFGAATAAYQIEGAVAEDGRKPSIWDAFSHTSGRTDKGDTGDIACDHYHRLDDDLDLARELGLDAYRFSIAWPRVIPEGRGAENSRGLDFYERVVDGCLARDIIPCATLYHWDLPLDLQRRGGWTSRGTSEAFADYAALVVRRLGDRVTRLATLNEPWCTAMLGHLWGIFAPGDKDLDKALAAIHYQNLAHGLGVQAMRAERQDLSLGIALNLQTIYPLETAGADEDAAERHTSFHNESFTGPIFGGQYPKRFVDALGDRMPSGWENDLTDVHQPLDWWGLNWYTPTYISCSLADDGDFPFTEMIKRDDVASTDIGWEIAPTALSDLLIDLDQTHDLPPCWITENGACYNNGPDESGNIDDTARTDYYDAHLHALADAIDSGCDVRGYFAWSLMDNFEWAEGYAMRFGLIHVDYTTQTRTPKHSAEWYTSLIREHRKFR